MFSLLFFVTLTALVIADGDHLCQRSCPPFWTNFGRNCYRYFGEPRTWVEAEQICNTFAGAKGLGHLVSIASDDENSFIVQLVTGSRTILDTSSRSTCTAHHDTMADTASEEDTLLPITVEKSLTWLGITDLKKEGTFTWADGSKVVYTNWKGEQNSDHTENRDSREHKSKKYGKEQDRDDNPTKKPASFTEGNQCGYIPVNSDILMRTDRAWDKATCDDTATALPYVCKFVLI